MKRPLCTFLCPVLLFAALPLTGGCDDGGTEGDSYTIRAEYDPQERLLTAEMTCSVYNDWERTVDALSFFLYPNSYREGAAYRSVALEDIPWSYYAGKSYGGIEIISLSGGDYSVAGEDENILRVTLPNPLRAGERAEISISFRVTLALVEHRLGVGRNVVTLTDFYPVLCVMGEDGFLEYVASDLGDPFVRECADYDVTLTVPSEYTAVCGFPAECAEEGEKTVYSLRAEKARDVAFVLGSELQCVRQQVGETTVEYWHFEDLNPSSALSAAAESLACFSELFGEYDGERYAVVQADLPYDGMECNGMALLSPDLTGKELPRVVAHETAHQWWYSSVGSNQFENAWQDEGLAEYSVALFLERCPDYGMTYSEFVASAEKSYRTYYSVRSQLSGETDTSMTRALTAFGGVYEYRSLVYDKGVILFDRVRQTLKDKRFFAELKNYAESFSGKIASPDDLIACFHRAGGSVDGIFSSFLTGSCVI